MIMPDWQYPHCGASNSFQAIWIGWLPSGETPFDRDDRLADGHRRGDAAGADRPAIDMQRARTALPDAAAELGARQPNVIADHPQQRRLRVCIDGMHVPLTIRSNAIPVLLQLAEL